MITRSKIEASMLIVMLSVGAASGAAVLPAHAVEGFKAQPLTAAGRGEGQGAPTLPGCSSQAGCRTASGGYLNGFHPGAGTEGGNGVRSLPTTGFPYIPVTRTCGSANCFPATAPVTHKGPPRPPITHEPSGGQPAAPEDRRASVAKAIATAAFSASSEGRTDKRKNGNPSPAVSMTAGFASVPAGAGFFHASMRTQPDMAARRPARRKM